MKDREIKACVSGSFIKSKDKIDSAIDELTSLGVLVLAPDKGWIYKPPQKALRDEFRPLPSEVDMTINDIENNFLSKVRKSDLLYVVNPEGYIGNSVSMEIGFAIALGVPVFLQAKPSGLLDLDERWDEIERKMKVCTIQEALAEAKELVS